MGVALQYFSPQGIRAESYFCEEGCELWEQFARIVASLSPAMW
jgi:hypothetical protein